MTQTKQFPYLKLASILIGMLALVLTFSRTAWLTALFVIGLSIAKHLGEPAPSNDRGVTPFNSSEVGPPKLGTFNFQYNKTKGFLYLLIIFSLVLPFLSFYVSQFFSISDSDAVSIRLQLFQTSWQIIKDHWLFGVGLGNFIPAASNYLQAPTSALLQPVHNLFWLVTSETGILGLIVTLWFLKSKLLNRKINLLPTFYFLLAILITATTDHYWLTLLQNRLLLAIVLGLII
jgi:O-antigen ligase